MTHIKIELDNKHREALDLLKQVIPNEKWEEIKDDSEIVWVLIDSFMWFLQEQAGAHAHHHDHGDWHCGTGSCGCSH